MVVTSRNMEEGRAGKRSLGPSPNGALSDDSSGSDDSEDHGMRVGRDFQAVLPPYNPDRSRMDTRAEAMLVWAPPVDLPEPKVLDYISVAKDKHGYNTEQALGMLFWHKHDVEKALRDLPNFTPFPDEWSVEDKVLYEQAFSFHGKSFARIRQMLPDKSIASLVKYYYSWKKTRARSSLMDKQARKLHNKHADSDDGTDSDSDFEMKDSNGVQDDEDNSSGLRSGPKTSQAYGRRAPKNKLKPPRGMHMNKDDLLALATGPPGQGEAILKNLETEIVTLKRQVQNNKQIISMQKHKTAPGIDCFRPPESNQKINPKWTNDELMLGVQGVRRYGKDFKAISEVLGTKTEVQVRTFFSTHNKRYNLDTLLAQYEQEHGAIEIGDDEEEDIKMEIDTDDKKPVVTTAAASTTTTTSTASSTASSGSGATNGSTTTTPGTPPPLVKQQPDAAADGDDDNNKDKAPTKTDSSTPNTNGAANTTTTTKSKPPPLKSNSPTPTTKPATTASN